MNGLCGLQITLNKYQKDELLNFNRTSVNFNTVYAAHATRPYLPLRRYGSYGDKIWFLCPEDPYLQPRRSILRFMKM